MSEIPIEVIPTVVPASLADIEAAAKKYAGFARVLHVDFADGVFAPNTTWLPEESASAFHAGDMVLEAHLMVADPLPVGLALARGGFARIIGHVEAGMSLETIAAWKKVGAAEAGIAILAQTPIESIDPFVVSCDFAMMMTIQKIGVQGLPFDEYAPERVGALHLRHPDLPIEVDGSVNQETIAPLSKAGARRFCAGSVLSKNGDPASTYRQLLALAQSAVE